MKCSQREHFKGMLAYQTARKAQGGKKMEVIVTTACILGLLGICIFEERFLRG